MQFIRTVLAWGWVVCLAGTLLSLFTSTEQFPIDFSSVMWVVAVRWGVLLLVWPMTRYFGVLSRLPRYLWGGLAALAAIAFGGLMLGPLGIFTLMPAWGAFSFLTGATSWHTNYVYFWRGPELMVNQHADGWFGQPGSSRQVQLTPLGPLFYYVRPLPTEQPDKANNDTPGYAGWTLVQKKWEDYVRTPTDQRALDQDMLNGQRYWAARRREDSLASRGQMPAAAQGLPAATRRGANTLGCTVGATRTPWRAYATCFDGHQPVSCRVLANRTEEYYPQHGYDITVMGVRHVGTENQTITLHLGRLKQSGLYRLGKYHHGGDLYLGFGRGSIPDPTSTANRLSFVRITRFDTVAQVVSGTFEGYLDTTGYVDTPGSTDLVLLQNGRFDAHYKQVTRQ